PAPAALTPDIVALARACDVALELADAGAQTSGWKLSGHGWRVDARASLAALLRWATALAALAPPLGFEELDLVADGDALRARGLLFGRAG
ncbi:MAG TPA: hypothetical protein VL172_05575, partial [Kofleriaceae bacterium]|nr:hypothetical protein [Kofleriaceae bacterium]